MIYKFILKLGGNDMRLTTYAMTDEKDDKRLVNDLTKKVGKILDVEYGTKVYLLENKLGYRIMLANTDVGFIRTDKQEKIKRISVSIKEIKRSNELNRLIEQYVNRRIVTV